MKKTVYRLGSIAIIVALGVSALAGCAAATPTQPTEEPADNVTELTVWARGNAIGEGLFKPLVDEWNATQDVEISLTLIPSADMPAKIATAAGANQLPDIIIADVGYLPALSKQGLLQDLSENISSLDYADELAPSAIRQGTSGDKQFAVPASIDASVMYVNKSLLADAGVDDIPTSLDEVAEAAKAVRALGDDKYGFYAAGSCGGCLIFTTAPTVWANDGELFEDDGTSVTLDTPEMKESLEFYQGLWNDGVMPAESKAETGSNWNNVFAPGNLGIQFVGASLLSTLKTANVPFDWDVSAIPGPTGGESSFIGGDVFTVTKDAQSVNAAWKFISWATEEAQQVDQYAKDGWLVVRTDLTDNEYTADDPRLQKVNDLIAVGSTPNSASNAAIFNDPAGPWLAAFRKAVYDGDIDGALEEGEKAAQALLDQG
ncbi:ABC transporter substrate-binding protein [Microbacterium sp.]|uniref:ABC transporter substrate-binding protein n=1 Tax=Microbacterium sp. TaxID=51671 RepID=UPI003F71FCA2